MKGECDEMVAAAQDGVDHAELRAEWRDLVERRLPEGWRLGWPVRFDHCFARILLDTSVGRPWREVIPAPAWKNAPPDVLRRAIATGEAVLADEASLVDLNRESLRLRGKRW